MDWSGRRVLVTGAGGFIGSHLTEALVHRGANARAFVHYNSRGNIGNLAFAAPSALRAIEILYGDLRDPEAVRRASGGVDTVFHLGALIAIPYSYENPRSVTETNLIGTLNVLEAARAVGAPNHPHFQQRGLWHRALYSDGRSASGLRTVTLCRQQDRRGCDGARVPSLLCTSGRYCQTLQHLWPPPIRARSDSYHHNPSAQS
jgi:NAD(P)-dependent dehydrogenase (short-subunit alcohol dehydrogenase family)